MAVRQSTGSPNRRLSCRGTSTRRSTAVLPPASGALAAVLSGLATSLGALFNASALLWMLRRRRFYTPTPGWGMFVAKIGVAAGVLAGVLFFGAGPASAWLQTGLAERAVRLALDLAAGGIAYFGALWLLGFRLEDFARRERGPEPAPALDA